VEHGGEPRSAPMPRRNVIAIGEAVHTVIEQALKKGVPVSNRRRRTAAEEEALRLRTETGDRERLGFGKKRARAVTDESANYMTGAEMMDLNAVPIQSMHPEVLMQLNDIGSSLTGLTIMEEIQIDRMMGKLRPFVEGEPIGVIQHHKRRAAPAHKTRNDIMDDRQKELRERQRRNDATLARMKERCR
jgi:hypothetical protein